MYALGALSLASRRFNRRAVAVSAWLANPEINGTPTEGISCTCSSGSYTGTQSFTYQWTRDAVNISGATAAAYAPVTGDVGHTLRRVTTPTDGGPSSTSQGITVVSGSFTDVPGPAGSKSITVEVDWLPPGTTAWVVEYDTVTRAVVGGYAYKKYVLSSSQLSVTITDLADGSYYCNTRVFDGQWSGLDNETDPKTAA